jgi:gliding motility-associated-like protein
MKKWLFIFFLFALISDTAAQQPLWYNNGALTFANYDAIVKVKGHMQNDAGGLFTNHGTTTIDSSYINDATSEGNGTYKVGLHWENNWIFIADTSEVILNGDDQLITGDSVSSFYDLTLINTGIKTQTLDANTLRYLDLTDRELATDSFVMHVFNTAIEAIKRTNGFVSSLGSGRLSRNTQSISAYLFPTGSSLGIIRYRPVIITPTTATSSTFAARLANNESGLNGFDRALRDSFVCELNPLYYHQINRWTGNANADLAIHYDPADDGNWDGISQWNTALPLWQDMSPVTALTPANPLNLNIKNNWASWSNENYILSTVRPETPVISGNITPCFHVLETYDVTNPGTGNTFEWHVTSGGQIISGDPNPQANLTWNYSGVQDTLSVFTVSPIGCSSWPGILAVIVAPEPNAAFTAVPTSLLGSIPVVFSDQSTLAQTWQWDFGDGQFSSETSPEHVYNQEGTYQAILVIQSTDGCYDTATAVIEIIPGLNIPNVFSPNGDGSNDLFEISGTNFKNFTCEILNRWGQTVFTSNKAQVSWDGVTTTGSMVVEGTYFVVLKITLLNGEEISYGGTVNVFY